MKFASRHRKTLFLICHRSALLATYCAVVVHVVGIWRGS